ncbi:MAG: hypothetical protein ACI9B8_001929, partial [Sulfitobacter sp.]
MRNSLLIRSQDIASRPAQLAMLIWVFHQTTA